MSDVTESFLRYRECARMVWNLFLREDADADTIVAFDSIREQLFAEIVLGEIGLADYRRKALEPIHLLEVSPALPETAIMVQRAGGGDTRYWDDPTTFVSSGSAKFVYVDCFDWDQFAYRDFRFVMVDIVHWNAKPELRGRRALLNVDQVKISLSASVATPG
jgi:hypothetical protein